jgi:LEA14-like dessication related protein
MGGLQNNAGQMSGIAGSESIFSNNRRSPMRIKFLPIPLLCMVVVAGLMILDGCAGFGRRLESPEISLANISLQEAKAFETTFELALRVFNTNDVPLEIRGIECELEINGNKLAKGVSATQTKVPAFGTELVRMTVYSSMLGMVKSMLDMIRSAQSDQIPRKMNYKISGRLSIGGDATVPWKLPFKSQGEVDLEGLSTGKKSS